MLTLKEIRKKSEKKVKRARGGDVKKKEKTKKMAKKKENVKKIAKEKENACARAPNCNPQMHLAWFISLFLSLSYQECGTLPRSSSGVIKTSKE